MTNISPDDDLPTDDETSPAVEPWDAIPAAARALVVDVDDVHIVYRVHADVRSGLRSRLRRLSDSGSGSASSRNRRVHAVRGVSFALREGDSLGIVGANGSGKSTLLAALTGLLPVESGRIRVRTRPVLLGVGAALRPQMSGRRNIELGCLAMGMHPDEIAERSNEIIEFAGLAEFIDLPLSAYSSGMRARLAFSIATVTTPDVLLIDEALAVGDEEFRLRSGRRIAEIRRASGAVILVSHSPKEIRASCNRVIWMDRGVVVDDGPPSRVVDAYLASQRSM